MDRIKLGGDKVLGPVLSCGSFEGDKDENLESYGTGEVDALDISEVTWVESKLCISYGEALGTTNKASDGFPGAISEGGMGVSLSGGIRDGK